jgi:hypothetical protein
MIEPFKLYVVRHRPTGYFCRGYRELVSNVRAATNRTTYQMAADLIVMGIRDGNIQGQMEDYDIVELQVAETTSTRAKGMSMQMVTVAGGKTAVI